MKQKNIEFLGCFHDVEGDKNGDNRVWKWGGGNTALKADGKFEFRPASRPFMEEYDMVNKCIEFVDPTMNTNAPFVIGLQNGNQCYYRKYDSSEFTNSRFLNTPKYECLTLLGSHVCHHPLMRSRQHRLVHCHVFAQQACQQECSEP